MTDSIYTDPKTFFLLLTISYEIPANWKYSKASDSIESYNLYLIFPVTYKLQLIDRNTRKHSDRH